MAYALGRSISTPNAPSTSGELSKDITLTSPPDDSISDLSWSPTANFLAVASWDSKVRIYDVTHHSAGEGRAMINFDGPVLSCAWSRISYSFLFSNLDGSNLRSIERLITGHRCGNRQDSSSSRSRRKRSSCPKGSCTRCPDPIGSILRDSSFKFSYDCHGVLGQDREILGPQIGYSCSNSHIPGKDLLLGYEGQTTRNCYSRIVY